MWLKNTNGKPDACLTFSTVTLAVVLIKFLLSSINIGPVFFGSLDAGVVTALLGSTLASYVARRHTDRMAESKEKDNVK